MIDIGIKDWIDYNPNIGTEQMHMIGLPGTGKSNMSAGLFQKCLSKKNEFLVMPGDRFCEWRHYPFHPKFPTKIKIIVPKDIDIYYHNFKKNGWFEDIDYENFDIMDHLNTKKRLLVIYDQHLPMGERTGLWARIAIQLLNRIEFVDTAVGLLFHEAGNYFTEYARGSHWQNIKSFSEAFVEFRRGLIRTILVSQLDTEIESTLRKKCIYACIRKTKLSRSVGWPRPLVKRTPFTALNEYHWVFGGLYNRGNTINKFYEKKIVFKMIPRVSMTGGHNPLTVDDTTKLNVFERKGKIMAQETDKYGRFKGRIYE